MSITLALPPAILEQAEDLAKIKEMGFDKYVSELVWVAVATHRSNLRLLEAALIVDPGDQVEDT
jgi:predicted outer membrane protein